MKQPIKTILCLTLLLTALLVCSAAALADPYLRIIQTVPDAFINDAAGRTYQAQIDNTGDATAQNATFSIEPPTGFTYKTGTLTAVYTPNGGGATPVTLQLSGANPVDITFATPIDLAPGDKIAFTYQLTTAASVAAGNTYYVTFNDYYSDGVKAYHEIDQQLIDIKSGLINLTVTPISPLPFQARRGEFITLEACLTNDGEGSLFGVDFGVNWGGNFNAPQLVGVGGTASHVELTPIAAGNGYQVTTGEIPAGHSVFFRYRLTVSDFQNSFALTGFATDPALGTITASAFFTFIMNQPNISINPHPITVDYGFPTSVAIDITNHSAGNQGPARQFVLNTNINSLFTVTNLGAGWTYANGVFTYDAAGGGVINEGQTVTLTFDAAIANPAALRGNVSGQLAIRPAYQNDLDQPFSYPVSYQNYSISNVPTLNLTQNIVTASTDNDNYRVFLDEPFQLKYTLTLTQVAKWNGQDIVFTYIVPTDFILGAVAATLGNVTETDGVITWRMTPAQAAASPTLAVNVQTTGDWNRAGNFIDNSANVKGTSILNCLISDTENSSFFLESRNEPAVFVRETKSVQNTPADGMFDVCGTVSNKNQIEYQLDYRFDASSGGVWTGSVWTEGMERAQVYLAGTATYSIDGGAVWHDVPSGSILGVTPLQIDLGFLKTAFGADDQVRSRHVLFRYKLGLTNASLTPGATGSDSFLARTDLVIAGASNGAVTGDGQHHFYQGVFVRIYRAAMSLTTSFSTSTVSKGQLLRMTVNVNKLTAANNNNLTITLKTNGSYSYRGNLTTGGFGGMTPTATITAAYPDTITFSFPAPLTVNEGGSLQFDLVKTDAASYSVQTQLDFDDDLGIHFNAANNLTPTICLTGSLSLQTSPTPAQVNNKTVAWEMQVTNIGDGTAYGVTFDDVLKNILTYSASTLDGSPASPTVADQGNGTTKISWSLGDLNPGESRIIHIITTTSGLTSDFTNASSLTGYMTWLDRSGVDHPFNATAATLAPQFTQVTSSSFVKNWCDTPVQLCADTTLKLYVKNNGLTTNYDYILTQSFGQTGFDYLPGTAKIDGVAIGDPAVSGDGKTLTFSGVPQLQAVTPSSEFWLTFDVRTHEQFNSYNTIQAAATWQLPTEQSGSNRTGTTTGAQYRVPQFLPHITVAADGKHATADDSTYTENVVAVVGDQIKWRIRITNSGATAKGVILNNVLPTNQSFVAIDTTAEAPVALQPGSKWSIADIAANSSVTYYVTAKTDSCTVQQTDQAVVAWGPETSSLTTPGKNNDTANLITQTVVRNPDIDITDFTTKKGRVTLTFATSGAPTYHLNLRLNSTDRFALDSAITYSTGLQDASNPGGPSVQPALGTDGSLLTWTWDGPISAGTHTITFDIRDANSSCNNGASITPVINYIYANSHDDSFNGSFNNRTFTPAKTLLTVTKTPAVQIVKADGDTVTWTIKVTNTGNAAATNLEIVDVLGDGTLNNGYTYLATTAPAPTAIQDNVLSWSGLTLNVGQSYTITLNAKANAAGLHSTAVTAREWNVGQSAKVDEVTTKANVAMVNFAKTLDQTLSNPDDPQADSFGEIVKYTIQVNVLDQSNYQNLTISDLLPAGLEFVDENHAVATFSPTVTLNQTGKNLTWTVGNFTGPGTITLTYRARIYKENAAVKDGYTLTNAAKMNFQIVSADTSVVTFPNSLAALQSAKSFVAKEPSITLSGKTSDAASVNAGQTVNHSLTVLNNGTAPGYEVKVTEKLPAGERIFNPTTGTVTVTKTPDGTVLTQEVDYTVAYSNGDLVFTFLNTTPGILQPAQGFTIAYQTKVDDGVGAGASLTNSTTLDRYYSQPSAVNRAQSYTGNTRTTTYTTANSLSSLTVVSPVGKKVHPGMVATYQATVTIPNLTAVYDIGLSQTLPAGLQYVEGSAVGPRALTFGDWTPVVSGTTSAGQTLTWSTAANTDHDVVNNSGGSITVTLTFDALVLNDPVNIQHGGAKVSNLAYRYNTIDANDSSVVNVTPASDTITVSEPILTITKSLLTTGPYKAQDTIGYRLAISNTSTETAYDVVLNSQLAEDVTYATANMSRTTANPVTTPIVNSQLLTWGADGSLDIQPGETLTVDVYATVNATAQPSKLLINTGTVTWTSMDGLAVPQERLYGPINNGTADFVIADPTAITKNITNIPTYVIGDEIDYRLDVTVLKGTTQNVTVTDTLPNGVELVEVTSITQISGVNFTQPVQPATGSTGTISWNFGTVTSSADGGSLTIRYRTRIQNNSGNTAGVSRVSASKAKVAYGTAQTKDTPILAAFVIKEPQLVMNKSYNAGTADAGNTVHVTVQVWHNPTATPYDVNAYDLTVSDPIPMGTTYVEGTANHGGSLNGAALTWNTGALNLSYHAAAPMTFSYDLVIDNSVKPKQTLGSTATTTWTSLAGNVAGERTGNGGVDNYTTTAPASFETVDRTALTKITTGSGPYPVGATVSYRLTIDLNEGTTNQIVVKDTLPTGLKFVDATITKGNNNISYSVGATPTAGATGSISWNLGDIVNPADTDSGNDQLTINYTTIIQNNAGNVQGKNLDNSAYLEYADGTGSTRTTTASVARITVVEPQLQAILTQVTSGPYKVGDPVTYQVTLQHSAGSNADAFAVKIADTLPAGLTYQSYTAGVNDPGAPDQAGPAIAWGNGGGIAIPLGQSYTFRINALVNSSVEPAQSIENHVSTQWSSLAGVNSEKRVYAPVDSNPVTVTTVDQTAIVKTILGTPNFMIGEQFEYQVVVSLNQGTTKNVTVNDTIPTGLVLVDVNTVTPSSGVSFTPPANPVAGSTGNIGWNFGTATSLAANGKVTIGYTVRIQDVAVNHAGDVKPTPASVAQVMYDNAAGIVQTKNAPLVSFTVNEPQLTIGKTVTSTGPYEAGSTVQYRISVKNTGNVTAFDTVITGILSDKLTLADIPVCDYGTVQFVQTGQQLVWGGDGNLDIAAGQTVNLLLNVIINNEVRPQEILQNNYTVVWTSQNGVNPDKRSYNRSISDVSDITTGDTVAMVKKILGTPQFMIGEPFDYQLGLTMARGTTHNVVIKDTLPQGVELVGVQIVSGSGGAVSYTATKQPSPGAQGPIEWDFSSITIPAGQSNLVNINYTVKIRNIPANQDGQNRTNTASMSYEIASGVQQTVAVQNATFTIKETQLSISKKVLSSDTYEAGKTVRYQITVENTGTRPAFDTVVTGILSDKLMLTGTPTNDYGTIRFDQNGPQLVWGGDGNLDIAAGQKINFLVEAVVNAQAQPQEVLENNYTVVWTSQNGVNADERTYNAGIGNPGDIAIDDPTAMTKMVLGTPRYVIGEQFGYQLGLTLVRGTTRRIALKDMLPQGVELVSTAIVSGDGGTVQYSATKLPGPGAQGELEWDFSSITIPVGRSNLVNITYTVKLLNVAANQAGQSRANVASASYDNAAGVKQNLPERSVSYTINEPRLVISKSYAGGDYKAGDRIPCTITVWHNATANPHGVSAYDVTVSDQLPANTSYPGGGSLDSVVASGTVSWQINEVDLTHDAANPLVLKYDLLLADSIQPQQQLTGNVTATWSSLPGSVSGERNGAEGSGGALNNYAATATAAFNTADNTDFNAGLLGTAQKQVGDTVDYHLTVRLNEGTTQNVTVKATLTNGLKLIATSIHKGNQNTVLTPVAVPSAGATGELVWDLGAVVNPADQDPANDTLVINLNVVVQNISGNSGGTVLTNTARLEYRDGNANLRTIPAQIIPVTVVEPKLTVGLTGPATIGLNQPTDFTLTVENTGNATAWQSEFTVLLPLEMKDKTPALKSIAIGAAGRTLTESNPDDYDLAYDNQTGRWTLILKSGAARLEPAEKLTVVFAAALNDQVFSVKPLTLTATVQQLFSTDVSGGGGDETRIYTPGTTATAVVAIQTPVIATAQSVDKSVARPGETVHYQVTVTNNGNIDAANAVWTHAVNGDYAAGSLGHAGSSSGTVVAEPDGGPNGSGQLTVTNMTIAGSGGTVTVQWDTVLKPVLPNGKQVDGQVSLTIPGFPAPIIIELDPVTIRSAPVITVQKADADPNGGMLAPGDEILYTLTIGNHGDEHAKNVVVHDLIPSNTTYVEGSTSLNGNAVADQNGQSPLVTGFTVASPTAAPGWLTVGEPATVQFRVKVDATVSPATVISNQAEVNADGEGSGTLAPILSDDPDTETAQDATRSVVGNVPLLYAVKTVQAENGNHTAQPGDTLEYQTTVYNLGTAQATDSSYADSIPQYTTYVANSVTLNATPVAVTPSQDRFALSLGTLAPGEKAVVTYRVKVVSEAYNTVITSQGTVAAQGVPAVLTDMDGNPANGSQPTDLPVGDAAVLRMTKRVADSNGGKVLAGDTLVYTITLANAGTVAATNVIVTDPLPAALTYLAGTTRINGATQPDGPGFILTNGLNLGTLAAQSTVVIEFQAQVAPTVVQGTVIDNQARYAADDGLSGVSDSDLDDGIEQGNLALNPNDDDPTRVQIGGNPGTATVTGTVWWDTNGDGQADPAEVKAASWQVELLQQDTLIATVDTDNQGAYQFNGILPGGAYRIRFRHPATHVAWKQLSQLTLLSGTVVDGQNLPLQPTGVVYDAVTRQPVAGAVVTLSGPAGFDPVLHLLPGAQNQVTQADGMYKLEIPLGSGAPVGTYQITVTPPLTYSPSFPSTMLAPQSTVWSYNSGQGTAVVASPNPPAQGETPTYYLRFNLTAGGEQLVNDHIPVDPILKGSVLLTKTAAKSSATVGDLILYTIKLENQIAALISPFTVKDRIPAGFKYVSGSARINGLPSEPEGQTTLSWPNLVLNPNGSLTLTYYLVVGAGVAEGKIYKNSATAYHGMTGTDISNTGVAQVQISADKVFSDSLVIGKVFHDRNGNGVQDEGEDGIPGVRLLTVSGQIITTDGFGRYHIPDIAVQSFSRGQTYLVKVDPTSLPKGAVFTTENPRVIRLTQGTMAKIDFGIKLPPVRMTYTPQTGVNNGPVQLALYFENLTALTAVWLERSGDPAIGATDLRIAGTNTAVATVNLTGAAVGVWDFIAQVRNLLGQPETVALKQSFTVVTPAPTVTAVVPGAVTNDRAGERLVVTGSDFRPGAQVEIAKDGRVIQAHSVRVISTAELQCDLGLMNAATGVYDLKVTNDDGQFGTLSNALTITEPVKPAPSVVTAPAAATPAVAPVAAITPRRGVNIGSVLATVQVAKVTPNSLVKLSDTKGHAITGVTIGVEPGRIKSFLDISQLPPGDYQVTVLTPNQPPVTWENGFTVIQFAPAAGTEGLLKPVYFDTDRAELRPDQLATLKANQKVLQANGDLMIMLGGNTDERASYEYNLRLSERRANRIREYLIKAGVAPERIVIYAYGKRNAKIGVNETKWQNDRRVDFFLYIEPKE